MPLLVTRAFMNKKDKAFLSNTHIYYSKGFLQRKGENCILNIFFRGKGVSDGETGSGKLWSAGQKKWVSLLSFPQ